MAEYFVPNKFADILAMGSEEEKSVTRAEIIEWIKDNVLNKLIEGDVVWIPDPDTGELISCVKHGNRLQ